MTFELRGYQQGLVAGIHETWSAGHRRVAAVMATGGGKTRTAMALVAASASRASPVLWIAHRTELISQAIDTARAGAPGRSIGRLQGRDKQVGGDIVVGSVQTCSTENTLRLLRRRAWGLIVIDECHRGSAPTYVRILRELGAYAPEGPRVLGITATLDRADGAALGEVFEAVAEPRIGLIDLIRHPDGPYLVPPRGVRVRIAGLELSKVKRTAGDYNAGALGQAMSDALAPQRIVEAWSEHCKGVQTLAFLPTVAMSQEQAAAFADAGVAVVHLDGTTPASVRGKALADFRSGAITVICNVDLFTQGTDLPSIECVIMGRPTSSTPLYQQMVGRGLRTYPGKRFCWVLDFTGVTGKHRLATLVNLDGADRPGELPDDLLMYEEDDLALTADEEKEAPLPTAYVDGDLAHEYVDLFGESATSWLRTRGGAWFTVAGSVGFLYLCPAAGDRYDLVGLTHAGERYVLQQSLDVADALAAGDALVAANPIWQSGRDALWRHMPARNGRTRGELADDKAIELAGALIDVRA